jgi:uncharacterized protein (DUF2147 family)
MRRISIALGLALLAAPALASDPVQGEWLAPHADTKVRLEPCAGAPDRLCGRISWLLHPNGVSGGPRRDINNPDPQLRSRPKLGLPLLSGFRRVQPGRWDGGKIYDPDSGKTYDSKLKVNPDGTLDVEGCILILCQRQTWKRAF